MAKARIESEETLTLEQKTDLKTAVEEIGRDTPEARNAALRTKSILLKVGGTVGLAVRDVIVQVASETAKRIIFGT